MNPASNTILRAWMAVWPDADKALAAKRRENGKTVEFKPGRPLNDGGADAGTIKKAMQRANAR